MGRLLLVATPIGNLEDMTFRGVEALRSASLILAEDTRHTRRLLDRFSITGRVQSYHQHNKVIRIEAVLRALETGDVALVTDAGMPSISDPGFELVQAAVEQGIDVDVLPGASAVVTAVAGAALPAPGFLFLGFLPRGGRERRARLLEVARLPFTLVVYEAPHRVVETMREMRVVLGERQAVAARELTKVHQEYVRGTLESLVDHFERTEPRGEFTLVVAGGEEVAEDVSAAARADLARRRAVGEDARTAVGAAMARFGLTRNEAYRLWVETDGRQEGSDGSIQSGD